MAHQSQVALYNLALSAVGTRALISVPTERSREAEICNLWYAPTRDKMLRAARWSFARAVARLPLLSEADDTAPWVPGKPEPPWRFMYGVPDDFLYPRTLNNWAHFQMSQFEQKIVILTNQEDALLTYTRRSEDIPLWDAEFYFGMVHGLAATISMPLHGKASRTKLELELANNSILQARVSLGNEDDMEWDSIPDWFLARGVSPSRPNRFVYENGPLMTLSMFEEAM